MPIKFSKSSNQYDRVTGRTTRVHDYMKCKSNADLIDAYNKEGQKPKLKAKVRVELERRNKIGQSRVIFK